MAKYNRHKVSPRKCTLCGLTYDKPPKETHAAWVERKYCSTVCERKGRIGKTGDQSNHWLGDRVGYTGIHLWLVKEYGKANKCEGMEGIVCKDNGDYEWAMLHEKGYARDKSHFRMLCTFCHRKYDAHEPWNKGKTKIKNVNCNWCKASFWPAGYRPRQFCSNTCSARFRAWMKKN